MPEKWAWDSPFVANNTCNHYLLQSNYSEKISVGMYFLQVAIPLISFCAAVENILFVILIYFGVKRGDMPLKRFMLVANRSIADIFTATVTLLYILKENFKTCDDPHFGCMTENDAWSYLVQCTFILDYWSVSVSYSGIALLTWYAVKNPLEYKKTNWIVDICELIIEEDVGVVSDNLPPMHSSSMNTTTPTLINLHEITAAPIQSTAPMHPIVGATQTLVPAAILYLVALVSYAAVSLVLFRRRGSQIYHRHYWAIWRLGCHLLLFSCTCALIIVAVLGSLPLKQFCTMAVLYPTSTDFPCADVFYDYTLMARIATLGWFLRMCLDPFIDILIDGVFRKAIITMSRKHQVTSQTVSIPADSSKHPFCPESNSTMIHKLSAASYTKNGETVQISEVQSLQVHPDNVVEDKTTTATPLPELFDVVFKSGLPQEFTCPKCEQALRIPMKTECGHHYCKICIIDGMKCMLCEKSIDQSKLVYDKNMHKAIQKLDIICSNHNAGCKWTDQLKSLAEHLSKCKYKSEKCENCEKRIPVIDYPEHVRICKLSVSKCEYCQSTIRSALLEKHLKTCSQVIISCPFQCGLKDKTRAETDAHRAKCPNAPDSCPFASMGCNFKGNKEAVQKHLSAEPVKHMIFLCDEMTELKSIYSLMHYEMSCIEPKHDELLRKTTTCEEMFGPQFIWRIDNLKQRTNEARSGSRTTIFSKPFMSGRNGYKMLASACLFGEGTHRGKCLSLYIAIMKGEYDGILGWPFRMMVKITLIDQKPKIEDRIDVSFTIDPRMLKDSIQFLHRPISERNASFGAQSFCSLQIVDSYIQNDAMFVKIEVFPIEGPEILDRKMNKDSIVKMRQNATPVLTTKYQKNYP